MAFLGIILGAFAYQLVWMGQCAEAACANACVCKDSQTITICEQAKLTNVPSEIPLSTVFLDLDHNAIQRLENRSLYGLTELEIVTIKFNRIYEVEGGVFQNLNLLRAVYLQGNSITYLPKDLFTANKNIEHIDLSHNLLNFIPDTAIMHLFNLQILNVSYNQIFSAFLGTGFQYTTSLQVLDLTGNTITHLEKDSFKQAMWWSSGIINMSACHLKLIDPSALKNIGRISGLILSDNVELPHLFLQNLEAAELKTLDLANTGLSTLQGYFDNAVLQKLESLSLARNSLTEIGTGNFKFMENLKSLDLSGNYISSIKNFNGLNRLKHLDLSFNRISQLNTTTFEGVNLRSLYLQYNNISHISNELFSDLFDLEELDIGHNKIKSLQVRAGLEFVHILRMSGNQLDNVAFLSNLIHVEELDVTYNEIRGLVASTFQEGHAIRRANFSHNKINTIGSSSFQLQALQVLDLSYNLITDLVHFGWKSPIKEIYLAHNDITFIAYDAFNKLSSLELLDLSYCGLKELPGSLFNGLFHLKKLVLSGNPLGYFPASEGAQNAFSGLPSLQYVSFKNTRLKELPTRACSNKSSLRELDVSDNLISSLHSGMCGSTINLRILNLANNKLQNIDSKALECLHSLETLDVSSNPFSCSCDFLPTCDWLRSTHIKVEQQHSLTSALTCNSDSNKPVADFCQEGHMTCDMQTHPMLWALIAGSAVFLMVMIAFCIWRLYMRIRKKRKLSRMMDREMEIQREKMLMQSQINQFYFKEDSL